MKKIVFKGEYQDHVICPEVGEEFDRGVPKEVTDEVAAILLAKHENKYLEADDTEIARRVSANPKYRPTPNPLFGLPKRPDFVLAPVESVKPSLSDDK